MSAKYRQSIFYVWILLTTLLLFGTLYIWQVIPIEFTGGKLPYIVRTVEIVGGHILALSLPYLLIRKIYGRQEYLHIRGNALSVAGVQILWRLLAVSLAHIDCAESCTTSITPQKFDYILVILTAAALIPMALWLAKREVQR